MGDLERTPSPILTTSDGHPGRTKFNFSTWLTTRLANSDVILLPRTSLSHLQSYPLPARFILNFYVSCGCWLTCRRSSTSISLGTKRTSGMSDSSGVGLAHSAIIGMRLALLLHTLQPYARICCHGSWHHSPHDYCFCSPSVGGCLSHPQR